MHFTKDVYISEKLKSKKDKIISDLKYGRGFANYYLLYENPDNKKTECMKSLYFRQKAYSNFPYVIEGIIDSYDEALEYMAKKIAVSMDVIYDD